MIVATINSGKSCLELEKLAAELDGYVRTAVDLCRRQYDVERDVLSQAIRIGRAAMDLYLQLQGNGDLGPTVSTAAGEELERSSEPVARPLRTVFGEHTFDAYVYAPGAKQKIVLRPIDARLQLPAGKFSYLYEEFSQYFCVEQAFGTATERLEAVLGQKTFGRFAGVDQPPAWRASGGIPGELAGPAGRERRGIVRGHVRR